MVTFDAKGAADSLEGSTISTRGTTFYHNPSRWSSITGPASSRKYLFFVSISVEVQAVSSERGLQHAECRFR